MATYIPEQIKKLNTGRTDEELCAYIDIVWNRCKNMVAGEVIVIKEMGTDYPELFIECAKYYMRNHEWQDGLFFTRGFNALQKLDISFTKGKSPEREDPDKSNELKSAI